MLDNANIGYTEEKDLAVLSETVIKTKEIDWKPAIIISAAYLKKFGILRMSKLLRNRKIKLDNKLEKFSFNDVSIFLYALHQINEKEFTQMNQIRKARNRIIHPRNKKNTVYFGEKADKKYGKMVENTINIISSLKSD